MNKKQHLSNDERAQQSSKERVQAYLEEIADYLPEMHTEVSKIGALAELVENNKELSETLRSGLGNMLRDIHSEYTRWQVDVDSLVGFASLYTAKTQRDDGMQEVTITLTPDHHAIIAKCAQMEGQTVEEWITRSTEGNMRLMIDELKALPSFEYIEKDIDEAIKSIPHSKELKTAVA